jgi:hypothetical protein
VPPLVVLTLMAGMLLIVLAAGAPRVLLSAAMTVAAPPAW